MRVAGIFLTVLQDTKAVLVKNGSLFNFHKHCSTTNASPLAAEIKYVVFVM